MNGKIWGLIKKKTHDHKVAVACSELSLGGTWTGLQGRDIPIAEDLLGIVRPGHHPEGEWARDLLEEKGLREGVYMSR